LTIMISIKKKKAKGEGEELKLDFKRSVWMVVIKERNRNGGWGKAQGS